MINKRKENKNLILSSSSSEKFENNLSISIYFVNGGNSKILVFFYTLQKSDKAVKFVLILEIYLTITKNLIW